MQDTVFLEFRCCKRAGQNDQAGICIAWGRRHSLWRQTPQLVGGTPRNHYWPTRQDLKTAARCSRRGQPRSQPETSQRSTEDVGSNHSAEKTGRVIHSAGFTLPRLHQQRAPDGTAAITG